jgi:DNA-cytosine methyltransferase
VGAIVTYTILSVFAGIGGLDLAAHWAGFETIGFIEREPFCQKVLANHWPGVPIHSDVFECHDLPHVDVIVGGFPCQPFSVAGNRKGADDERYLLPEMLRIIREVKPYAVLFENVPGFPSLNDGAEFKYLLRALAEMGFDAEWGHIRASDSGAPHQRERWFCVAYSTGYDGQHVSTNILRQTSTRGMDLPRGTELADGSSARLQGRGEAGNTSSEGAQSKQLTQRYGELGNVHNTKRQTRSTLRMGAREPRKSFTRPGGRSTQSGVCRESYGISYRLDRFGGLNGLSKKTNARKVLRILRIKTGTQGYQWAIGRFSRIQSTQILQPGMHGLRASKRQSDISRIAKTGRKVQGQLLRGMRRDRRIANSSYGLKSRQQYPDQLKDIVRYLSSPMALGEWQIAAQTILGLQSLRAACKEFGLMPEAFSTLQEIWRSLSDQDKSRVAVRCDESLRIVKPLPAITDFAGWPARPGEDQHAYEPSRVTSAKTPDRAARLKALGNAVVPQVAYPLFVAINEWLREIKEAQS